MNTAALSVIFREAVRSSRQKRFFVLRSLTGLVALFILVVLLVVVGSSSVTDGSELARMSFRVLVGVQVAFAGLVGPLVVATAFQAETDEGTLDLLALSRLTPSQLLWGVAGSRLLVVASVVIGTLPIAANLLSFGGVGGMEIVLATSSAMLLMVYVSGLAGVLATAVESAVVAVGLSVAWGVFSTLAFLSVWTSPWLAMASDGLDGLAVWLVFLPTLLSVLTAGPAVFRARWMGGERGGWSWPLERYRRHTWYLVLLTVAGHVGLGVWSTQLGGMVGAPTPGGPMLFTLPGRDSWALLIAQVSWCSMALAASTRLWMLACWGGSQWLRTRQARAAGRVPRLVALRRAYWVHPVFWREVFSRAMRGPVIVGRVGLGLLGLVFMVFVLQGEYGEEEVHFICMALCTLGGIVTSILFITTSITQERKRRTLGLLMTSTTRSWMVLPAKYAAVMVRLVPWVVVFLLLWTTSDDFLRSSVSIYTPLRYGALALWYLLAWLVLMGFCSAIALFVRPTMTWISVIGACIFLFMGLVLCTVMLLALEPILGSDPLELYFATLCPILDEAFHQGGLGLTWMMGVSLVFWASVAATLHAGIALLAYRGPAFMRASLRAV